MDAADKQSITHTPVLLQETITALDLKPTDIVVDGTFGGGGHSQRIFEHIPQGKLICVDLDEAAGTRFQKLFQSDATEKSHGDRIQFVHGNFKDVSKILEAAHVQHVDKVLLDLGTSTFQLLADTRGFSFQSDTPLSMTFSEKGSHTGFTAATIVNEWEAESIADIIYYYGEEPKARVIAQAIVEARKSKPFTTAASLAACIESVVQRRGRLHPATKTFQALRIAVNDELETIRTALGAWFEVLSPNGRIAVITFHSLEDRIVKHWMQAHKNVGRVITKKPLMPTLDERHENPRARSAKLRIFERP